MDTLSQAKSLIEKSRNIYIFLPENHGLSLAEGDLFCAGSALFYSLKKMEKKASLFFEKIPKNFQFLSNSKFVISINTRKNDVSELLYEKNGKDLKIYLTSAGNGISSKDISFASQNFLHPVREFDKSGGSEKSNFSNGIQGSVLTDPDLLITLGAQSLEDLGKNFVKNSDLFYQIPVLNIDNNPRNQNFGEVNLVEIKTSSVSEILYNFVKDFSQNLIDENIATLFLSGVIWASENFRNSRTKPKTFEAASSLIERGADHQKIIQNFYKTKSLAQIKLLGQVLKKISFNPEKELYSAKLTKKDFKESGADSKDLAEVLQELKFNFGSENLTNLLLLWESHASPFLIKGVFCSSQPNLIEKVLENFEGTSRGKAVLFLIREKDIDTAHQKFLETI